MISVCYVFMEPFVGSCASVAIMAIFVKTGSLVAADAVILGWPVWKVALAIHVAAWILQFIGHGFFEGKYRHILSNRRTKDDDKPSHIFWYTVYKKGKTTLIISSVFCLSD